MARIAPGVRLIAAVVALVVLIAGAVGGLIIPVYSRAASTTLETVAEEANLSSVQALAERRRSVKLQSAQTEAEILQLANRMPERIEVPLLIVDIYELGTSCNVKLPLVSVGEPGAPGAPAGQEPAAEQAAAPTSSSFSAVPVNLSARGSWTDVMEFHRRVRDMYRSARVKTSTITYVPAAEGAEAYINADLQLEFYLSAVASSATTQTAPVSGTTGP